MKKHKHKSLVDQAVDAYAEWREACASVWDADERWVVALPADVAGTFSAYGAALDRDQCASRL